MKLRTNFRKEDYAGKVALVDTDEKNYTPKKADSNRKSMVQLILEHNLQETNK